MAAGVESAGLPEEVTDYPPFPNTSERLRIISSLIFFRPSSGEWVEVEKLTGLQRDDLRNYCRCYWMDEVYRFGNLPFNDCKNFDDISAWVTQARENAAAWREWKI